MECLNVYNICLITSPLQKAGLTPVSNLVNILKVLTTNLYLITGNEGDSICRKNPNIYSYSIQYKHGKNLLSRIIRYTILQLRICFHVIRLRKICHIYIFFISEGQLLPILVAGLMGRKTVLCLASSAPSISKRIKDPLSKLFTVMEHVNYHLATRLIIYSANLIHEWKLEKFINKISIAHEHFIDLNTMKVIRSINERNDIVGFIGRMSYEKGVHNFVYSIPYLLEQRPDLHFLVCGDGPLKGEIQSFLDNNRVNKRARLVGWIEHEELPEYLNRLKLLILPSYSEGLPNIVLEAMACGTPVLAIAVGAISDIIKDGETGFIMEDNSPDCIARNVNRAINHPELIDIAQNARAIVSMKFTYEAAVQSYKNAFGELNLTQWRS